MIILGVGTPFVHDPSAAILVDGKVVAACDEERLIRKKHAMGYLPIKAVKFCLDKAGFKPSDIDAVAFPWSHDIYKEKKREYFWRCFGRCVWFGKHEIFPGNICRGFNQGAKKPSSSRREFEIF